MEFPGDEDNVREDTGFWYTKADCNVAHKTFVSRLKDFVREPLSMDIPGIRGLFSTPEVSLSETVESLTDLVPNIDLFVQQTSQYITRLSNLPEGIAEDDLCVLLMCTWPWEDLQEEKSLYHLFNSKLRSSDRQSLVPYLPLLKLFLIALYKLPAHDGSVWCGTREDVTSRYKEDTRLIWWGFSSYTEKLPVVMGAKVLGKFGTKTLFNLKTTRGFRVNLVPGVSEVIIPPGLQMKVLNVYNAGHGVKIVELQEVTPEVGLIDFPGAVFDLGLEEFFLRRLEDYSSNGQWDRFVQTMKTLPLDKEIYLYVTAFQTLCQSLTNGDLDLHMEDRQSLIELTLRVMKRHVSDRSLQTQGCSTLKILGVNDFRIEALEKEVIETMTLVLKEHVSNPEIQLLGNSLLPPLLHNDRNRRLAGKQGLVQSVVLALKANLSDCGIYEVLCQVLAILSLNEGNRDIVMSSDGLTEIVDGLRVHLDNPSGTERGLLLMARLFIDGINHIILIQEGWIELVIESMKRHPNHTPIQQNGCLALARLFDSTREARDGEGIQEAVNVVISAMKSNPSHSALQRNSCLALARMAGHAISGVSEMEKDGIQTILNTMAEHEDNEGVQEAACELLATLCQSGDLLPVMDKLQLVLDLTKTMVRHFDHRGVQANACRCLAEIWTIKEEPSDNNESKAANRNAVEAVIRAITCHNDHAATQAYGYHALARICENSWYQNLMKNDGIIVAISALGDLSDRPVVQHQVLMLLNVLSKNAECQEVIAQNDGVRAIAKALVARPYHSETQEYGCHILSRFATNTKYHKFLSEPPVLEAVTSAKLNCSHDDSVQKYVKAFFHRLRSKKKA